MKPASLFFSRRARLLACLGVLLLGAGLPAAHATWGENFGSVHFNSGEPDFGTPPRRAAFAGEDSRPGGSGGMSGGPVYTEFSEGDLPDRKANQALRRARFHRVWEEMLARGEWRRARQQIAQEILSLGVTGSVRDRAEVLDAVLALPTRTPALTQSLHTYFYGMRRSDEGVRRFAETEASSRKRYGEAAQAFEKVSRAPAPDFLRAHSLYQRACLSYQEQEGGPARELYARMCREFPHSPKKPDALLMTARAGLLLPGDRSGREAAKKALDQLRGGFPTRYPLVVQGLYGRYWYLDGQFGKAADIYFGLNDVPSLQVVRPLLPLATRRRIGPRLLRACLYGMERATNYYEYATALKGVDREMQELTPDGAKVFVARLFREPGLAAPYFYYRLYYTDTTFSNDGDMSYQEYTRKARARLAASRRNLLGLAARMVARSGTGATRLPAPVRLRLAEVYYQERRYAEALRWVQSVLDSPVSPPNFTGGGTVSWDRALYVRGAIYQKQNRVSSATSDFERLLAGYPTSALRPAAREELALLYEAAGRNDAALDQYFALRYDQDVAYLLDVRMTTREVADYRSSHPRHAKTPLLTYSLGVRQLRDDDLSAARRTLKTLSRTQYADLAHPMGRWGDRFDSESPDPLRVIDDLVTLRQNIARARTREARALALYRHASYHYKNGLLLFYNTALWQGSRIFDFDVFWNRRQMTPGDRAAIRNHMYRHEVYVRVIDQCRQIADRYPNTAAAPLALYRAACASDHLSELNQWWENEENQRHNEGKAALLLRRLARRYPRHPLGHNARKYAVVFARADNEAKKEWEKARKEDPEEWKARAY